MAISSKSGVGRRSLTVTKISDLAMGWELVCLEKTKGKQPNPYYLESDKYKGKILIYREPSEVGQKSEWEYVLLTLANYVDSATVQNMIAQFAKGGNPVTLKSTSNKKVLDAIYSAWAKNSSSQDVDDSEIVKQIHKVFSDAEQMGVSDIHFEVRDTFFHIRMRVNGGLSYYSTDGDPEDGYKFGNVIYQVLTATAQQTFKPKDTQDALVETEIKGKQFRARLATAPAYPNGFDMVLRLLKIEAPDRPKKLSELGYLGLEAENIQIAAARSVGLIVIAGTTGSGKSTTLQHILLAKIKEAAGDEKIISVEDPVEYYIPGATQIPIVRGENDAESQKKFMDAMKAAMRLDPEIINIGEVRDEVTAKTLVKAVQSGHKVFTTIHASSALSIISRLADLGIKRDVLGSPDFIAGLVYQKLLPVLCGNCCRNLEGDKVPERFSIDKILERKKVFKDDVLRKKRADFAKSGSDSDIVRYLQDRGELDSSTAEMLYREYDEMNDLEEAERLLERIKSICDIDNTNIRFKGDGCEKCNNSGIAGRVVVSEVIRPDLKMLDFVAESRDSDLFVYWRKRLGGRVALEDAYEKMKKGMVDPYDLEKALSPIGSKLQ